MIRRPYMLGFGLGFLTMGPALLVTNTPPGDMFWEWRSFAVVVWFLGIVMITTAFLTDDKTPPSE